MTLSVLLQSERLITINNHQSLLLREQSGEKKKTSKNKETSKFIKPLKKSVI